MELITDKGAKRARKGEFEFAGLQLAEAVQTSSTQQSLVQNEHLLQILFECMALDTVDVLLVTSRVSRSWKTASDQFLLRHRASGYKDTEAITTREAFVGEWQREQELFWRAHAVANPPDPPEADWHRYVGMPADQLQHNGLPFVVQAAFFNFVFGAPYFPVTNPLRNHLHQGHDTWNALDYRYFLRLSEKSRGLNTQGLVELKSVWRPSVGTPPDLGANGSLASPHDTDCFLFDASIKVSIPRGHGLQMRFDITSLTSWDPFLRRLEDGRKSPFVGLVAISKETGECSPIAAKRGSVLVLSRSLDSRDDDKEFVLKWVQGEKELMILCFKLDSEDKVERAELVVLVTQEHMDSYVVEESE